MRRALEYCTMLGIPVIAHEEDANLTDGGVMHEGYFSTLLGMGGIPAASEETLVARDVILARADRRARAHRARLDRRRGRVGAQRARGRRPRHLRGHAAPHRPRRRSVQSFSTNLKMNPPLRSKEHRDALLGRHRRRNDRRHRHRSRAASFRREERRVRSRAVRRDRIGDGVRRSATTSSCAQKVIDLDRLIDLMSCGRRGSSTFPAERCAAGAPGDVTLLDLDAEMTVHDAVPIEGVELAVHRRDAARPRGDDDRRRRGALRHRAPSPKKKTKR